jgi:DNA-binding protein HU-beta
MNKGELVELIAKKEGITKRQAGDIVDTVLDQIVSSVRKGDDVRLVGFGTFYSTKRKARMGVNPQTKEKMKIPARTVPKFRAGSAFKDAVA